MTSYSRFGAGLMLIALLSTSAACSGADPSAPEGDATEGPIGTSESELNLGGKKLYAPELSVAYEELNGQPGFRFSNWGFADAGAFRIAVLAGGSSYSIMLPGLPA